MSNQCFIMVVGNKQFMPVKAVSAWYGKSENTIRVIVREMEMCGRYAPGQISINDDGDRMIDTLAFEDYLRYRGALRDKNLARRLKPYDPAESRYLRGEYMVAYKDTQDVPAVPDSREQKNEELKFIIGPDGVLKLAN